MVNIGIIHDTHVRPNASDSPSGGGSQMIEDYDHQVQTKGAEDVYLLGDQVHPNTDGQVPHIDPAAYDRFWSLFGETADGGAAVNAAIPGNHDVPIQGHLEADDRAVLRKRVDYPDDGVTVLLMNTYANGLTTGGPAGYQSGIGPNATRTPYADLKWLDDQLADAGDNAKLVLSHAPLSLLNTNLSPGTDGFNGEMLENDVYNVPMNWKLSRKILSKYDKTINLFGHVYQFANRGHDTINGVDYVYKYHYHDGSDDTVTTLPFVDIDSSSAKIVSIDHSDKSETTLIDKTF